MLKILIKIGLGFLLFTNSGAHQITTDALLAATDALAAEQEETSSPNNKKSTNEARHPIDDHYYEKPSSAIADASS